MTPHTPGPWDQINLTIAERDRLKAVNAELLEALREMTAAAGALAQFVQGDAEVRADLTRIVEQARAAIAAAERRAP